MGVTSYDGDRVTLDQPAGGTDTATISDALGRTTELRQYSSGSPSGSYDTTSYQYDRAGRPTQVTDAMGDHWDYTYDLLGRRTRTVDPDGGSSTSTYAPRRSAGQSSFPPRLGTR